MSIISKIIGGGGGGLTEAQVDARVVDVAPTAKSTLTGFDGPASVFVVGKTLADNAAFSYDFGTGVTAIVAVGTSLAAHRGLFSIKTSTAEHCTAISATGITATTGVLDGTTGADATVTVSAHTDNKFYFENRSGASLFFQIMIARTQVP